MTSVRSFFDGERYKIIFIGDCGVGKTSLFWRYLKNELLEEQRATIVDFGYKTVNLDDRKVKLCVWDTAGQQKFRSIVATYFKSCQGVVMVFDLTQEQSWRNIKEIWYPMAHNRVPSANYLLLGNKKDLQCTVNLAEVVEWCASNNVYFVQTSAKTGQSVEQALFTLAVIIDSKSESSITSSLTTGATSGLTIGTLVNSNFSVEPFEIDMKKSRSFFLRPGQPSQKKKNCC